MSDYSVIGRAQDANRQPVVGFRAHVYRAAGRMGSEEHLADGRTDAGGRFSLRIAESALSGMARRLRRPPQVLLKLIDPSDRVVLTSRPHPIEWQLEYRIYLGATTVAPDAPDIYAHAIRLLRRGPATRTIRLRPRPA